MLTVAEIFSTQAKLHPGRVALQEGARRLTYAMLNERVNRLAHVLAVRGVARGDRVAILSENRAEYLELDLAAAKLGAAVACQNWRLAGTELAHCLALAEAKLVIVSPRYVERVSGPALVLGEEYERALAGASAAEPPERAHPEDALVVLYTSGTTGLPKGAVISQRAIVARGLVIALDRPTSIDDAFIAWTPLFHMGSTDNALGTFLRGGKVIVMDGFDASGIVDLVAAEALGWLTVMPGTAERVADELQRRKVTPKGVRYVGAMADLVPREAIASITRLLDAPYVNTFGSTETGSAPASRGLIPPGHAPDRLSKTQSSLCTVRLLDAEGREVADGTPGELAMRGPTLFSGYIGVPTEETFEDGWYRMGDVFVRNPDGTLDFVDRRKYLIKSGGENIYPAEIERLLLASPRITEAAVVRRADARWGEVPVAFVVPSDGTLTADEVLGLCRGRIAGYKLPKEVRLIAADELPRSASGKIVRHELEARLA